MKNGSILSDDLVRDLVATGRVDVLVGLPTLDNAATVAGALDAIHSSFATSFLRERTVLINLDEGSTDGTVEIVKGASPRASGTVVTAQSLRTVHRISRPYHGLPGKGGALRTLFAAAELTQARAIALFDADVTSIEPVWVERLVRPILENRYDYVAPRFERHPLDGPLVSQLIRPVVRSAYGHRLQEPLASEFACSGDFAAHCLREPVWESPLARFGIDLWLSLTALARGFRAAQTPLGPRVQAANPRRPGFPEIFQQVVGALFDCLDWHQEYWPTREASEEVTVIGSQIGLRADGTHLDPTPMAEAFRSGVADLAPILAKFLASETLAQLSALAGSQGTTLIFPDELWVSTLVQAAAAHRRQSLHREYLLRSLLPLYLGRAASFILEGDGQEAGTVDARVEDLALQFEGSKPQLVEAWRQ